MTWLLTGGAGYIGPHIVRSFLGAGKQVVVLDNLSNGFADNVADGVTLIEADLADADAVRSTISDFHVSGVVHLAALKAAGESVEQPLLYYRQNVMGMLVLLEQVVEAKVRHVVFSSSAATYGETRVEFLNEETPTMPSNPYGETKLIGEWMLRDVQRCAPVDFVALRYFNVAGAGDPALGDRGVNNLIPMVFRALSNGESPLVFGADYDTEDGSCIRDYIHVADLADAHLAAAARLERLQPNERLAATYNVGRGQGATVFQVMEAVREVSGIDFEPAVVARRLGDPARVVADPSTIERELGWTAHRDLHDMVTTAWASWLKRHPETPPRNAPDLTQSRP